MRFGESFPQGADPKNRMDVLKINKEQEDVPDYIKFGLKIRDALKAKIEKNGWPDLPNQERINVTEDIFESAKNEVNKTWEESVKSLIESKAEEWKKDLKIDNPETRAAFDLLNNPEEFSKNFSLRQFGVLETLRAVNPRAWRTLVVASSERQLASIAIMEHWLKNGDNENLKTICEKISLSPEELKLFVDTAAILGKYVDHAYVKQIELADSPGGSAETKLGEEDGAQYLYDLYKNPKSEDIDIKTYSDIFPYTNAVSEVASANEVPLINKIFNENIIDVNEYSKAAVTETILHETGHNVLDYEDKKISKRIGKSFETGILEELKAETVGMKILYETFKRGDLPNGVDLKTQLLAKLGTNLDYLKNKSDKKAGAGEPYYICGATIFNSLFKKGLIIKKNSGYDIVSPEACIKEIAGIGDKVLSFYTNSETKPIDVKNYIRELRVAGQEHLIKDLIGIL